MLFSVINISYRTVSRNMYFESEHNEKKKEFTQGRIQKILVGEDEI